MTRSYFGEKSERELLRKLGDRLSKMPAEVAIMESLTYSMDAVAQTVNAIACALGVGPRDVLDNLRAGAPTNKEWFAARNAFLDAIYREEEE